jgi:hypothetical protein
MRRALVLAPSSADRWHDLVIAAAATGDLSRARAIVREAYQSVGRDVFEPYIALYFEFAWVLEPDALPRVLEAPLASFDGDVGSRQLVQAQVRRLMGDMAASRTAADRALAALRESAAATQDDAQSPMLGAFAAALAGRTAVADSLVAAARAIEARVPPTPSNAVYFRELRAKVASLTGRPEVALDELEALLTLPGYFAPGHLALDPIWTPLRSSPRYQRLIATVSPSPTR